MTEKLIRRVLFLIALSVTQAVIAAKTFYQNDFTTRTSSSAVPTPDWHVKHYAYPASLCYRYLCAPASLTAATPYGDVSQMQDGWIKSFATATALSNLATGKYNLYCDVTTNTLAQYATEHDATNPFAVFYGTGAYNETSEGMAVHPIGNAFSTGILRVSADLRPAELWPGQAKILVRPMFDKAMEPGSADYDCYPVEFGFFNYNSWYESSYKKNMMRPYANGKEMMSYEFSSNVWRRLVVTMDLDNSTWSAQMFSLGTVQPLPDAAPGSETTLNRNKSGSFHTALSAETGPISGIALIGYGINRTYYSSSIHYENAPKVDNLKVEWKAPGTDEFVSCYENDFATCKYRTLSPDPSPSHAYAPGTVVATDSFSEYPTSSDKEVLNATYFYQTVPRGGSYAAGYLGEPGVDGWRRLNAENGAAYGSVHNWGGSGGAVLRAVAAKSAVQTGTFVNRFGRTVTSGKVKASADIRLMDAWHSTTREVTLLLGGSGLYTAADGTSLSASTAVRAGIGNAAGTEFNPGYYAGGTFETSSSATLTGNAWYRAVVTADLDAQTYDYALYSMGTDTIASDAEPSGSPVFEQTGIAFRGAVADLATIGFYASSLDYSPASTKAVLFDNVKVWTVSGGAETLVYANDFATRTAYGAATAAEIVDAAPDRIGTDGWFRRGAGFGRAEIAGTERRCLALSPERDSACVVHELGTAISNGTFKFSVDIRPPSYWTLGSGFAHVMLGGEEFFRGELGTASAGGVTLRNFEEAAAIRFGIGHNTGDSSMLSVFRETCGCAYSGSTLLWNDATFDRTSMHWYRYKVRVDMGTGKWSLKVYELGAAVPTVATPTGAPVFEADGLDMCEVPVGGITSVGIKASGCTTGDRYWAEAGGGVLFGNLTATTPEGMSIILK